MEVPPAWNAHLASMMLRRVTALLLIDTEARESPNHKPIPTAAFDFRWLIQPSELRHPTFSTAGLLASVSLVVGPNGIFLFSLSPAVSKRICSIADNVSWWFRVK